jgi:hypothetical protein
MAKRNAAPLSEDDAHIYESEGEEYQPAKKRPRTKTTSKNSNKANAGLIATAVNSQVGVHNALPPHGVSRHVIVKSQAKQIDTGLMAWYETVHTVRGKPVIVPWTVPTRALMTALK